MKQKLFSKFKVILFVAFFICQAVVVHADEAVKKYVTMRVYETSMNSGIAKGSKLIVVYENGQIEETKLEGMRFTTSNENIITINAKINELASKGYDLVSVTGSGNDINITTYTFRKK